jgi:superfamily I DNA/RNA helicase
MRRVEPAAWRPRGVGDLEPNAWTALREQGCVAVVAGPGAGKTEFLAQRAAYLLQTGICPASRRILAISFKTDAAANLAQRVEQRCPPELARRFVSQTFDSFTKGLVDRFLDAIPAGWRPTRPYSLLFPTRNQIEGFLDHARRAADPKWSGEIAAISPFRFEPVVVGPFEIPLRASAPATGAEYAAAAWLRSLVKSKPSTLTFTAINRLAQLLIRANPQIGRALRATYPFVFVDEFQDTTFGQYSFLRSAFGSGSISVTVVGDDKQRIMGWAGARLDAFSQFERDFAAKRVRLLFNFRSSPELVSIQHVIARRLEADAQPAQSQASCAIGGDAAQVWVSDSCDEEASHLASWLKQDMTARGKSPRDYAILVRQKADQYEEELSPALEAVGLRLRNQSRQVGKTSLQDLLVDTYSGIATALLRLGASTRDALAWNVVSAAVLRLREADEDDEARSLAAIKELSDFVKELRAEMAKPPSIKRASELAAAVLAFLDAKLLRRTYLEYAEGDLLDVVTEAVGVHLASCSEAASSWTKVLDLYEGKGQVPMMTVHKSKGLEYDTIVFVGMDDAAWWSFRSDDPEGLSTFFVALTRAKQRAIFSFCKERGRRSKVAPLFELLTEAGVPEVRLAAP